MWAVNMGRRVIKVSAIRRAIGVGVAMAAGLALAGSAQAESGPADGWSSRITASYKVIFNGFNVGDVRFTSQVTERRYSLTSHAELSALLGALKWRGVASSSGEVTASEPRPAGYAFDYRSATKQGAVKLGFGDTGVRHVDVLPPAEVHPDAVPLAGHHLENVLDPLSAVLALTRGGADPCARKLAVFDGKQRFDLTFSYLRQQKFADRRASGQPDIAVVCRVHYARIAGHRLAADAHKVTVTDGIEVALRPVPAANLMIPVQVTIPTMAGTAVLKANRIEIEIDGKERIALVR